MEDFEIEKEKNDGWKVCPIHKLNEVDTVTISCANHMGDINYVEVELLREPMYEDNVPDRSFNSFLYLVCTVIALVAIYWSYWG